MSNGLVFCSCDHWTLYLSRNLDLFLSCSTDLRSGALGPKDISSLVFSSLGPNTASKVVDNKKGIEMKVTSQISPFKWAFEPNLKEWKSA